MKTARSLARSHHSWHALISMLRWLGLSCVMIATHALAQFNWELSSVGTDDYLFGVGGHDGTPFVAAGWAGKLFYSLNGETWNESHNTNSTGGFADATIGIVTWAAVGDNNLIRSSNSEAGPWKKATVQNSSSVNFLTRVEWANIPYWLFSFENNGSLEFSTAQYLAVGGMNHGVIFGSGDGGNWKQRLDTRALQPGLGPLSGICGCPGRGWMVTANEAILQSNDGIDWAVVETETPGNAGYQNVAFGNGRWVVVGPGTRGFKISVDGRSWIAVKNPAKTIVEDVVFGGGWFVACETSGRVLCSRDGVSWVEQLLPTKESFYGIAYSQGCFVMVGTNGITAFARVTDLANGPPIVTTLPALNAGPGSATLRGAVNPNGAATTYAFNIGLTKAYVWPGQTQLPPPPLTGRNTVPLSVTYTGLQPSTTYHYRIRATNGYGSVDGQDATFTTPAGNAGTGGAHYALQQALTAQPKQQNDYFGSSAQGIALQGDTLVVGAAGASASGQGSVGKVYVFTRASGAWSQAQVITCPSIVSGASFGTAIAMNGSTMIVGAPGAASGLGQAYVFVKSGATWVPQGAALSGAASASGNEKFGSSVALNGDLIVVGAPFSQVSGLFTVGRAYAFERSGSTWSLQQTLPLPTTATSVSSFGTAVAMTATTLIISSPGRDTVHTYTRSGSTWFFESTLAGTPGESFGQSLAVAGSLLAVGCPSYDLPGQTDDGRVLLYARAGNAWVSSSALERAKPSSPALFGLGVATDGTRVAPTRYGQGLQVFSQTTGQWAGQDLVGTPDIFDSLGASISGSTVAIGSSLNLVVGGSFVFGSGAAFVYALVNGPTVDTPVVSAITPTSATLTGGVHPQGTTTVAHFDWGMTTAMLEHSPGQSFTATSLADSQSLVVDITDLAPETTYYYRLTASSGDGTQSTSTGTLTTDVLPGPKLTAAPLLDEVTTDTAALSTTVDPAGVATDYYIEYGLTPRFGFTTPVQHLTDGSTPASVSFQLTGLQPGTRYYARVVVLNTNGTTLGNLIVIDTVSVTTNTWNLQLNKAVKVGTVTGDTANSQMLCGSGRYVFYATSATEVRRKDIKTSEVKRVSETQTGVAADGSCKLGGVTADGRYAVLSTNAPNLTGQSTYHIVKKDMETGSVTLVSKESDGTPMADGAEFIGGFCNLSSDGKWLLFQKGVIPEFGPVDADRSLVRKNLVTGDVAAVYPMQINFSGSVWGCLNSTGQFANFFSYGSDLDPDHSALYLDGKQYVTDFVASGYRLVNFHPTDGVGETNKFEYSDCTQRSISKDGRYVLTQCRYPTWAHSVSIDWQLFVRDMQTGTLTHVNIAKNGNASSDSIQWSQPTITEDGRYVAFHTSSRIRIKDLSTGDLTDLTSKGDYSPCFSADGNIFSFVRLEFTAADNYNGAYYIYVQLRSIGGSTPANVKPTIIRQPVAQLVAANAAVAMEAQAIGDPAPTFQWLKSNAAIATATGMRLTLTRITTTNAGTYSMSATNKAGKTVTAAVGLGVIDVDDSSLMVKTGSTATLAVASAGPGLTYEWRKAGVILGNGGRISGATAARLSIAKYEVGDTGSYTCLVRMGTLSLESGVFTLGTMVAPVLATFAPAAWRMGGVVNDAVSISNAMPARFTAVGLPPGVVLNASNGRLTGTPTKSGTYTLVITATNEAGSITTSPITFTITSLDTNLMGTFNGIVARDPIINNDLAGKITFTTTAAGSYTGRLTLATASAALKGKLDVLSSGTATAIQLVTIPGKANPQTLSLSLDSATGTVTGSVVEGANTAPLLAQHSHWNATKVPATALAAYYTAVLQLRPADAVGAPTMRPGGIGHTTLTATTAGAVSGTATLGDGTVVTLASALDEQGRFPLHLMLYKNTGSAEGWSQLTASATAPYLPSGVQGSLTWLKKTQGSTAIAQNLSAGFPSITADLTGTRYLRPSTVRAALNLADSATTFQLELLHPDLTQSPQITISGANSLSLPSYAASLAFKLSQLKITPITGSVTGSFTRIDVNPLLTSQKITRIVHFNGVILSSPIRGHTALGQFQMSQLPAYDPVALKILTPITGGSMGIIAP